MQLKALRFRLYPNSMQEKRMLETIEACRHLWNDALAHRKGRWETERKPTSYHLQQAILTTERARSPELRNVNAQVCQEVLRRLDHAFVRFFKGKWGYPRFKRYSESGSFTYPQAYNGSGKPDPLRKRLYLSKIGNVRAVFHRPLPKNALLKTVTVIHEPCGQWYASLLFEDIVQLQNVSVPANRSFTAPVGVDLGLNSLITTSDSLVIPHPHFLRRAEQKLKHLQRGLSRKKKGSSNRGKLRHKLAVRHAKVKRQRADFNHKLSTSLVRKYDLIVLENLQIKNMLKYRAVAKSIQDAGWNQLVKLSEYKALDSGKLVVKVRPAYTTQECIHCGVLNPSSLDVREFDCRGCGRRLDRDINAAMVILKRGLAQVAGQGMPEYKPVETGPLFFSATRETCLVDEAGSPRLQP